VRGPSIALLRVLLPLVAVAAGACGTARLGRVALDKPAGLDEGRMTTGRSCAWSVLGIPLGAPALDAAVLDALEDANAMRAEDRGPAFDALVDVYAEEQRSPFRRCLVVRGRPVTLGRGP
jgi:hypothetical protein